MTDLGQWMPRERPRRQMLEGRFIRLEPLDAARHGDALFAASSVTDAQERFRWLPDWPPADRDSFQHWLEQKAASAAALYFAVVDKASGEAAGRQSLMRIDEANGVAEIGDIYWGPAISRTPAATEAFYLFARHLFDDLGYRRYEWKCDDANGRSKRAAERFGMQAEGVFRQHRVVKGINRDTAWFAMLDSDWPLNKQAMETWLAPGNFDADGRQRQRLSQIRQMLAGERS